MSNANEKRINKLLNFPLNSYLMLRLDYVVICGDELEAKILRIIEMYMEDKRNQLYLEQLNSLPKGSTPPEEVLEIAKDVWVPISHRTFMYDLYGMVKSENTLKRAITSLIKKKFIFMRYQPGKKYEAPEYRLNIDVIQQELDKVQKLGKSGYQKLIPSKSDTIKNKPHQKLIEGGSQELTPSDPSRVSEVDTNSRKDYEKNLSEEKESIPAQVSAPLTVPQPAIAVVGTFIPNSSQSELSVKEKEHTPPVPSQQLELVAETPNLVQQTKNKPKPKAEKKPPDPLVIPSADARWCAETAVQIVEAIKGTRYSKTTRSQELTEAGKVLEMEFDSHPITREEFEQAWEDMSSSSWWKEHNVSPMIKHLRKDDKIVSLLAFMARRNKAKSPEPNRQRAASPNQGSAVISEEAKQRNIQRLRDKAAAAQTAAQQGQPSNMQTAVN